MPDVIWLDRVGPAQGARTHHCTLGHLTMAYQHDAHRGNRAALHAGHQPGNQAARPTAWAGGVVVALGPGVLAPVAVAAQALPPRTAQTAKDIVQTLFFMYQLLTSR